MTDEEIKRINFLARKSKESGLSDEEKEEQRVLRSVSVRILYSVIL